MTIKQSSKHWLLKVRAATASPCRRLIMEKAVSAWLRRL